LVLLRGLPFRAMPAVPPYQLQRKLLACCIKRCRHNSPLVRAYRGLVHSGRRAKGSGAAARWNVFAYVGPSAAGIHSAVVRRRAPSTTVPSMPGSRTARNSVLPVSSQRAAKAAWRKLALPHLVAGRKGERGCDRKKDDAVSVNRVRTALRSCSAGDRTFRRDRACCTALLLRAGGRQTSATKLRGSSAK
jgi:hypothetical protein